MIKHVVMLHLRADYDPAELAAVVAGLDGLEISGFTDFTHGVNRDLEHKTPDYPYGFICTFNDLDALRRYQADPAHRALGQRLVALCAGGAAGIMVMDLEV
tara:strand:+ start:593 stop:895 length:303 start_codon:yes stop_codon:yes gene_type:complete